MFIIELFYSSRLSKYHFFPFYIINDVYLAFAPSHCICFLRYVNPFFLHVFILHKWIINNNKYCVHTRILYQWCTTSGASLQYMNTWIHACKSPTAAQGYMHNRQPPGSQASKRIRLCVSLERQADAGSMAGGQAGTQKVREEGRQMERQTDR